MQEQMSHLCCCYFMFDDDSLILFFTRTHLSRRRRPHPILQIIKHTKVQTKSLLIHTQLFIPLMNF
jgi:hypothetical protein